MMGEIILKYFPIVISVVSITLSLFFGIRGHNTGIYFDIDKQYKEILAMALQKPELRDIEKTSRYYLLPKNNDYYIQYNLYAYIVWNCLETIYDHMKKRNTLTRFKSNTWLPVIKEENKIHYTWFKHNIELFKPEFYNFVINKVNDLDIEQGSSADLKKIYSLMEQQFPLSERKSYEQLEKLLAGDKYMLHLAKHRFLPDEDNIVGYSLCAVDHTAGTIWLDYLAVGNKYQNAGYGTVLFKKVINELGGGKHTVFFELEIPDDIKNKNDVKLRRMNFYKRLGSYIMPFDYYLPTPDGKQKMLLGVLPPAKHGTVYEPVTSSAVKTFLSYIHSDIGHVNEVIGLNLAHIKPFDYPPKN